jgi:Putative transposase
MLSWHHSGFYVYLGPRIWPDDEKGLENLARYIIRACFSQQRMVYIPAPEASDGTAKVIYTSKDGKSRQTFDALDWLARLVVHIPGRYEHTVRYYGYYSNKSRGLRKKAQADDQIATIMPNEMSSSKFKQNWARQILKFIWGRTKPTN